MATTAFRYPRRFSSSSAPLLIESVLFFAAASTARARQPQHQQAAQAGVTGLGSAPQVDR